MLSPQAKHISGIAAIIREKAVILAITLTNHKASASKN